MSYLLGYQAGRGIAKQVELRCSEMDCYTLLQLLWVVIPLQLHSYSCKFPLGQKNPCVTSMALSHWLITICLSPTLMGFQLFGEKLLHWKVLPVSRSPRCDILWCTINLWLRCSSLSLSASFAENLLNRVWQFGHFVSESYRREFLLWSWIWLDTWELKQSTSLQLRGNYYRTPNCKGTLALTCCLLREVYWLSATAFGGGGGKAWWLEMFSEPFPASRVKLPGTVWHPLCHCFSQETQKSDRRMTG